MTNFEKETYKNYFIRNVLNDKRMLESLIIALTSGATVLGVNSFDPNIVIESATAVLGVAGTMPLVLKTLYNIVRTQYQLENTARPENHESYIECLKLYREYVNKLAKLLQEIPVKDSLQLSVLIDSCIANGFFSYNGRSVYQQFSHDCDGRYSDLLGTRVLVGECVCRHNTVFAADLLNAMGYDSYYVSVDSLNTHNRSKFTGLSRCSDHAVTGIIDQDGKYIYDFTWHKASYFDTNLSNKLGLNSDINIYHAEGLRNYYSTGTVCTEGYVQARNWFHEDLEIFNSAPFKKVDLINANEYIYVTERLLKEHYMKLSKFSEENTELTNEIVRLSKILIPYSSPKVSK